MSELTVVYIILLSGMAFAAVAAAIYTLLDRGAHPALTLASSVVLILLWPITLIAIVAIAAGRGE